MRNRFNGHGQIKRSAATALTNNILQSLMGIMWNLEFRLYNNIKQNIYNDMEVIPLMAP